MERRALIGWNDSQKRWVLSLWDDVRREWSFSRSWPLRDMDPETGFGWVNDSILEEIARLQDRGYTVKMDM